MGGKSHRIAAALGICIALALGIVGLAAGSSSAQVSQAYHSAGTVKLSGGVSGTLKVNASLNYGGLPGCSISGSSGSGATEGGTIVIDWDNVKLKVGGKLRKYSFVELETAFPYFGKAYSMNEDVDAHAGATLTVGLATYSSVSGTAKTVEGGFSGSDVGSLKGSHGSLVKVVAHYKRCSKPRQP